MEINIKILNIKAVERDYSTKTKIFMLLISLLINREEMKKNFMMINLKIISQILIINKFKDFTRWILNTEVNNCRQILLNQLIQGSIIWTLTKKTKAIINKQIIEIIFIQLTLDEIKWNILKK